jgi:hypothetical protein
MNRSIEVEFSEEPAVEIQPVTRRKKERNGFACNFWLGWQLFKPSNQHADL